MSKTRLLKYIEEAYGSDVLEQVKKGTKQVLFNGTVVEYNEKFREKRVTEGSTKIEVVDVQPMELLKEDFENIPEKVEELPQGGKLDENCYLSAEPFATQSDISPEEEERLYQAEIAVQRQHENKEVKEMATVIKADGTKRFPIAVGSSYISGVLEKKETRNTNDMIIPDDAKTGEYQGTNKTNNEEKAKVEISPETNKVLTAEEEEHFNNDLRTAKVILELHELGEDVATIGRKVRIAESRVKEIVDQGIEKTEEQIRRWYKVPAKGKTDEKKTVKKNTKIVEDTAPETEPVTQDNAEVVPTGGRTRIKGGVKLAEEAIVAMLKEKPMTPKDLKAATVEGVNPSTWVIRISKLKSAGKITLGADGMYTAV